MEIIVVSDGSTDSTDAIASQYADRGIKIAARCRDPVRPPRHQPQGSRPLRALCCYSRMCGRTFGGAQHFAFNCLLRRSRSWRRQRLSGNPARAPPKQANVGLYWRYERWIRKNLSRIDSTLGATGAPLCDSPAICFDPCPPITLLDGRMGPDGPHSSPATESSSKKKRRCSIARPASTRSSGRKVRTLAGNYQLLWQYPDLLTTRNTASCFTFFPTRLLACFSAVGLPVDSRREFSFSPGVRNFSRSYLRRSLWTRGARFRDRSRFRAETNFVGPRETVVSMLAATALRRHDFLRPRRSLLGSRPGPRRRPGQYLPSGDRQPYALCTPESIR